MGSAFRRITAILDVRLKPDSTCSIYERLAPFQVRANRGRRAGIERDEPLLAAFAQHPRHPGGQIDVFEIEARHFAEPEPRRIEELEDRAVAASRAASRRPRRRCSAVISSSDRWAGMRTSRFGVATRAPGSSSMSRLTAQITQEGSDGRKLARGGRARLTSLVERGDEPADGVPIERSWPQLARLYARRRRPRGRETATDRSRTHARCARTRCD